MHRTMTVSSRRYHITTFGCQMNKADSERMAGILDDMGMRWVDDPLAADLVLYNTCTIRDNAEQRIHARLDLFQSHKKKAPEKVVGLIGCMAERVGDQLLEKKKIDLVAGPDAYRDLPYLFDKVKRGEEAINVDLTTNETYDSIIPKRIGNNKISGFVSITRGCNNFCTFCIVPYTRGREVSRPSKDIVAELALLVTQGYKSITLLGQNVNSYGLDKKGEEITFPQLLREIGELGNRMKKDFWVYFTSPHPRDMTDEVIEVIAEYPVLAKQIHLPMQSGDDKVLMRMNRKHNMEKYRHIVETIRRIIPQATLFTDIIVGFTGETEEQFDNTRKAMNEFKFNMSYTAIYSPRPGATSHRWADDVEMEEKKRRLHMLTEELRKHNLPYNSDLVGKTLRVLVRGTDRKEGFLSGHTEGKLIVRFASEDENLIGQFADVKITSASDFSMEGELVQSEVQVPA